MRKNYFFLLCLLFFSFININPLLAFDISVIRTEKATILKISSPGSIKYQTLVLKNPPRLQIELLDADEKVPAKKWLIKEGGIEEIESVHEGILGFISQKNFIKIKFTRSVLPYQIFQGKNLITVLIENSPKPEVKPKEPEKRKKSHTVKSGENLYRIAKKYDVTVSEIQKANHLHSDHIFVGQRLLIPEIKREIKKSLQKKKKVEKKQKPKTEEKTVAVVFPREPVSVSSPVAPLPKDKPEPKKSLPLKTTRIPVKKPVSIAEKESSLKKSEKAAVKKREIEKRPLLTEGIVAVVNKEIIFKSELDKEVKSVLERYGKEVSAEELNELRKEILDKLIENKILLQQAKREGIVPPREAVEEFKKQLTAMALIKREIDSKIKVSEDEIKFFYQEHQEDFMQPPGVKISEISLSVPSADEKEWNQAKIKMDLIKELCTDAESFDFFAYQLKDKKEFFVLGGQFHPEGKLPPELNKIVTNLKEGESSEVIKIGEAYSIIRLDERISAQPVSLTIVKPEIERIIFSQKREICLKEWLSQLKKNSVIEKRTD